MDEPVERKHVPEHHARSHHKWSLKRIFITLVLVILFFVGGVAVGRGNIQLPGLSAKPATAANGALDFGGLNQVYSALVNDFDGNLSNTKLLNGAKEGLVAATGDPFTEFFDPTAAKELNNELAGSITGIGAEIGADPSGNIQVVSPIAGYPAAKAGLHPKDLIAAVNGTPTQGWSVDTAVTKIRGPVGSKVTLTLIRGGGNPFNVTITRAKITIPSVTWSEDTQGIGYLKISQFTDDTVNLAKKAANEFKAKHVKAVVLDLRGNPGGYLDGAVKVSSLWLDQGQTVVSERRGGKTVIDTEYATGDNPLRGLPTVVLIDGGSASASEITAGALHDNHAATLVGAKSFGKGSVQQVVNFPDGSELKVTVAHWYTPNGKNINHQGITPDVKVSISADQAKSGQDPQKAKAYEILKAKL